MKPQPKLERLVMSVTFIRLHQGSWTYTPFVDRLKDTAKYAWDSCKCITDSTTEYINPLEGNYMLDNDP